MLLHKFGNLQVEARIIHENDYIGVPCHNVLLALVHVSKNGPQMQQYGNETHIGQFLIMFHSGSTDGAHQISSKETEIRLWFIRIMQDRTLPLPLRLGKLGDSIYRMDAALQKKDAEEAERLLENGIVWENPANAGETDAEYLRYGLSIMEEMVAQLDGRSDSIRELGEEALAYFGNGEEAPEKYRAARGHFESVFPDWEIFFEHMLVNHMFFSQFPYQDRPEKLMEEFIALCAVYSLLRFLTVGCMAEKTDEATLIDICAALFRLVEHTEFDRLASRLLRNLGCSTPEDVWKIINL